MNKILGDAKSVRELLSQKYGIDYYQRDYKWESRQIRELIEDLTTRFSQDFDSEHERSDGDRYGRYFLGSIIVSEKNGKRFIVDGQQRLTSLTLLLIYLGRLQQQRHNDQSSCHPTSDDRVEVVSLIYSDRRGTKSFNLDVDERNDCLRALIDGKKPDPTDPRPSVQNLIYRFDDIADIFPDELRGEALPYFLDWLTENVTLVEITAFSDNDAYMIFETMNDRGLSLTPAEMLKGYLLASITDNTSRAKAKDVWKRQTLELREFGKDEDADCIKVWLRSQYADKIRERKAGAQPEDFDKLGTEFHRWMRENSDRLGLVTGADFTVFITEHFQFYARAYAKARHAAENYTDGLTSIFFNAQNSFTLQYPLMLSPLRLTDDEETVHRKICLVATFIDIMLARRIWNFRAISHSTMQYGVFRIMKDIRGMEFEELRADLARRLSPGETERDDYIDFRPEKAFQLHGTNGPQVHRLLARLTDFLEVRSGEASRYLEYANRSARRGGYQIEHIWANHPERHRDEFDHDTDFITYRDRVGGLVLLPAGENASYSDMTYAEKVKHYAKQNLLACSLHPIAYENKPGFQRFRETAGLPFEAKRDFRRADLDQRQELYNALADLCWSSDRLNEI